MTEGKAFQWSPYGLASPGGYPLMKQSGVAHGIRAAGSFIDTGIIIAGPR